MSEETSPRAPTSYQELLKVARYRRLLTRLRSSPSLGSRDVESPTRPRRGQDRGQRGSKPGHNHGNRQGYGMSTASTRLRSAGNRKAALLKRNALPSMMRRPKTIASTASLHESLTSFPGNGALRSGRRLSRSGSASVVKRKKKGSRRRLKPREGRVRNKKGVRAGSRHGEEEEEEEEEDGHVLEPVRTEGEPDHPQRNGTLLFRALQWIPKSSSSTPSPSTDADTERYANCWMNMMCVCVCASMANFDGFSFICSLTMIVLAAMYHPRVIEHRSRKYHGMDFGTKSRKVAIQSCVVSLTNTVSDEPNPMIGICIGPIQVSPSISVAYRSWLSSHHIYWI